MASMYTAKKYGSYLLSGMLPSIFFIMGLLLLGDLIIGIVFLFIGIFGSSIFSTFLTRHAFTQMMEGQGLVTLTLDSTGVVIPFITKLAAPFIHGTLKGKEADGVYNRDMVGYLTAPKKGNMVSVPGSCFDDGKARSYLEMPTEDEKADYLFRMDQYPCFFYNRNIDAYLSKDSLSTFEKEVFTKNNSLFILKKTQQLSSDVRDFARYIVEHAKPKSGGIFGGKGWMIIIVLAIVIIIFALLFGPALFNTLSGAAQNTGSVLPSGGGPIN